MKKLTNFTIAFLGFIAGAGVVLLYVPTDIDLLAEKINKEVRLKAPMTLINSSGSEFQIPAGVNLLYKSRYSGVSTLQIVITTEETSMLQPVEGHGLHQYYLRRDKR